MAVVFSTDADGRSGGRLWWLNGFLQLQLSRWFVRSRSHRRVAADFINSELWSSAVTVEMNGKGSVTGAGRWDVWMDGGGGPEEEGMT